MIDEKTNLLQFVDKVVKNFSQTTTKHTLLKNFGVLLGSLMSVFCSFSIHWKIDYMILIAATKTGKRCA